jgi:hypothetical protein
MSIAFVGAGAVVTGQSPSVPVPSGVVEGDFLILVINLETGGTVPAPSGWSVFNSTFPPIYFYHKFATSSETSVTLNLNNTATCNIIAYRNAQRATSSRTGSEVDPGTELTTLGQDTNTRNNFILRFYSCGSGNVTTFTVPEFTAARVNFSSTLTNRGMLLTDEFQSQIGTSPGRTTTVSTAQTNASVYSLSIEPKSTPNPGVQFVGVGSVATGASPTLNVPTGVVAGDTLIILSCTTVDPTTPVGWTPRSGAQGGFILYMAIKTATSSESPVTLNGLSTDATSVMMAYRGFRTNLGYTAQNDFGTVMESPLEGTSSTNNYIFRVWTCDDDGDTTFTIPNTTTARINFPGTLTTRGLLATDELQAESSSVPSRTSTLSVARQWTALVWPMEPQPVISFVGAGAVATGRFPTVPVPSGVVQGDLLLIVYTVNYPTNFTPSGWTIIGTQNIPGFPYGTGNAPNQYFLYKFAGATESPVTLNSVAAFDVPKAVMIAYRGVADIDVVGSFNSATTASPSTLSQTTAFDNEYIVSVFSRNPEPTSPSTWTVPSGVSERVKSEATSSNGLLIVDELQTSAGSTTVRTATLQNSRFWASGTISLRPIGITSRNLYWVGGSQLWNTTAGTNWSNTSGGLGGELPPTAADNVYFDSNSGSSIVNIVAGVANNLVCTGFTGTLAGSGSLKVYGDFTLNSTMTYNYVGTLMFATFTDGANRTLRNITTAGKNLYSVDFNHFSGRWTLVDNLTVTTEFRLTSGTLNGISKTITCSTFISTNEVTRRFDGNLTINVTGNNSFILHFVGRHATNFFGRNINLTYAGSVGTRRIYLGSSSVGSEFFSLNVTAGSDIIALEPVEYSTFNPGGLGRISALALNFTGFAGTLDLSASSNSIRTGTSVTLSSLMTVIPGTTQWFIQGFSPTLSFAGKTLYSMFLNTSGTAVLNGNMVLLNHFSCPGSAFNANNYNVTVGSFRGRAQGGNFNMGNGTWTLTGPPDTNTGKVWQNDTGETNASQWISGTSTIVIADTTTPNVKFTNSGHSSLSYNAIVIAGGNATNKITFENPNQDASVNRLGTVSSTRTSAYTITLPSNAPTVVTSWLADGANSSNRIRLESSTPGTQATLSQSSGVIDVFNMIIQDIAAAGCARFNANTSQDAGNNTGWGFGGAVPPDRCAFNFFLVF